MRVAARVFEANFQRDGPELSFAKCSCVHTRGDLGTVVGC